MTILHGDFKHIQMSSRSRRPSPGREGKNKCFFIIFSFKFRHFLAPLCWRVCSAIASQSFFQPFQPSHNGYMYVKYSLKVVNLNLCKIAMNKIVSKNVN